MCSFFFSCCNAEDTYNEEIVDRMFSESLEEDEFRHLLMNLNKSQKNQNDYLLLVNNRRAHSYLVGNKTYDQLGQTFRLIVELNTQNKILTSKHYKILSLVMILSQTFYIYKEGTHDKLFVQDLIMKLDIFQQENFWCDLCTYHIDGNLKNIEKEKEKQLLSKDSEKSIIVAKITSVIHNMILFRLPDELIDKFLFDVGKKYNIENDELMSLKKQSYEQIEKYDNNYQKN